MSNRQRSQPPSNLYGTNPPPTSPLTNVTSPTRPQAPPVPPAPHSADGDVFNDPEHPASEAPDLPRTPPPPTGIPPPFTPNLANTLDRLTEFLERSNEPRAPKRARVREPDTFHGTDPQKLRAFLMQCHLNFSDRPEEFSTGNHKVVFALSYLRGIVQSWFEPGLANLTDYVPDWYNNWEAFVSELKLNFGPHDPVGDAEAAISRLRMRDSARITSYIVEFNSLAGTLQWGDAALRHRFYEGLPARLKDEICRGDGKPTTLQGMRTKAQQCDARYWERRTEMAREAPSERPRPHTDHRHSVSSSSSSFSRHQQRPQPTKSSPLSPMNIGHLRLARRLATTNTVDQPDPPVPRNPSLRT